MKHTDDDGELSVLVSGDLVLFACSKGHAWTAPVSIEPGVGPTRHQDTDVEETEDELEELSVEHERYAELVRRFGPALPRALGFDWPRADLAASKWRQTDRPRWKRGQRYQNETLPAPSA